MIFKNRKTSQLKNISSILLALLFVFYFVSTSLFWHQHYLFGKIYVHSHPYPFSENSKSPKHSHSFDELEYFEAITKINELILFAFIAAIILNTQLQFLYIPKLLQRQKKSSLLDLQLLRAPPTFSF